ncbi:MAG: hypothetical protein AB1806_00820 [Acidobacteriota bacterium]
MTSPDRRRSFSVERRFEALWDGSVVRFQTKAEVGSPSEGYYYWDREAKQVAVLILNARGVHRRGTVSVRDGVITVEGRIAFPERAFDYRNTFELRPDGTLVDRWFQNAFGDWRPGHVVELKARVGGTPEPARTSIRPTSPPRFLARRSPRTEGVRP